MADPNATLPVTDSTDGTTGSAAPSAAQLVGGTDGTNLRALLTDTAGKLDVKARNYDASGNGITSESVGSTRNLNVIIGDSYQRDAWGRVRVSDTDLIESLHFADTAHPLLMATSVTGGATVALNTSLSAMVLTNSTASGDQAILQTKRYFRYNPGRSYIVSFSANLGAKKTNVQQRMGYFDANNGLFFQQDQSNLAVVVRTNSSGSPVDSVINQSAWNLDKLDGTGPSGFTLDTSKHNLYFIDFLWHGAGRIRFGVAYNGSIIYCHQVQASNVSANPYMRTPSLPLRAELNNTGAVASSTALNVVCFAYQKEASDTLSAPYHFSAATGRTATVVSSTTLPIISIRPKATFNSITNRTPIVPDSMSLVSSAQPILVSVLLNTTLTGASWTSADTNSAAEYDISATAVSGGTVIKQFYLASSSSLLSVANGTGASAIEALILGLNIAGNAQDVVSIVALSTAGNTNVFGQLDWNEYQ